MAGRTGIWIKALLAGMLFLSGTLAAQDAGEVRMVNGFNDEAERARCNYAKSLKVELVAEHATEGAKAAKITCPTKRRWTGLGIRKDLLANWGAWDYFTFDVFSPYDKEIRIFVRIDDDKSRNNDYSTQYGRRFKLLPGANRIRIKTSRLPNQVQPWLQRRLNPNKLKAFYIIAFVH